MAFLPEFSAVGSVCDNFRKKRKPVFGFCRFFLGDKYFASEIGFRYGVIRFSIVCANTCCRLNELLNHRLGKGCDLNSAAET